MLCLDLDWIPSLSAQLHVAIFTHLLTIHSFGGKARPLISTGSSKIGWCLSGHMLCMQIEPFRASPLLKPAWPQQGTSTGLKQAEVRALLISTVHKPPPPSSKQLLLEEYKSPHLPYLLQDTDSAPSLLSWLEKPGFPALSPA